MFASHFLHSSRWVNMQMTRAFQQHQVNICTLSNFVYVYTYYWSKIRVLLSHDERTKEIVGTQKTISNLLRQSFWLSVVKFCTCFYYYNRIDGERETCQLHQLNDEDRAQARAPPSRATYKRNVI